MLIVVSFQHVPKGAQSSSRAGTRSSFFVSSEFNTVTHRIALTLKGVFLMCERGKKARGRNEKKKWFSIDLFISNDLFNSIVRITIYHINSTGKVKSVDKEQSSEWGGAVS